MVKIIRGNRGDNTLFGTAADERFVGGAGNDYLYSEGGHDDLLGGRGADELYMRLGSGRALGGVGNDHLQGTEGLYTLVGGSGHDYVFGTGALYGDERPGLAQRTIGNDTLETVMGFVFGQNDAHTTQTGGRGADTFRTQVGIDGIAGSVLVTDFVAGQDKVGVSLQYGFGDSLNAGSIFAILDTNANGVLGDDTPWDANSAVTVGSDGLTIRLHEDTVDIAGISSLSASDWAF